MIVDVVLDPFGATMGDLVAAATTIETSGIREHPDAEPSSVAGMWVTDHFSGAVVGAPWSRDPFVCLGAVAAVTDRARLGVLVANIVNRHPAQLASAVNSLQSLAPGRVVLGVGSGAAPGSRFAVEHDAIGTELADTASRRRHLRDYIGALRAIWAGSPAYDAAAGTAFDGLTAVVDGAAVPRIIVGASAWPTIELAAEVADGVNVRCTPALPEQLRRLAALGLPDDFEISVLDDLSRRPSVAPVLADASRPGNWVGVRRRIVTVRVAPGADARLAGDGFRSPA